MAWAWSARPRLAVAVRLSGPTIFWRVVLPSIQSGLPSGLPSDLAVCSAVTKSDIRTALAAPLPTLRSGVITHLWTMVRLRLLIE